jgi:hypothetical protein
LRRLIALATVLLFSVSVARTPSTLELIARKWSQVGFKSFNRPFKAITPPRGKIMEFRKDGTYEEEMAGIRWTGAWKLDADSTRFAIAVTELKGVSYRNSVSIENTTPTNRIITLTRDTLIFAAEALYGPDKIPGHDDWYFVPLTKTVRSRK